MDGSLSTIATIFDVLKVRNRVSAVAAARRLTESVDDAAGTQRQAKDV